MHALPHSVPLTLQQAITSACLCRRLVNTHRQVRVSLLCGHCSSSWVLMRTRFCSKFSLQSQRKAMPNYCTITLISHASKVMLKILQARLQQYVNRELPDVQAGFRKGRGIRDQIDNSHWIIENAREFQKKNIL